MKKVLKPFVVCGPSGVGKGTLIGMLLKEFSANIGFSISHTTRPSRGSEKHGVEYYFVTKEEILKRIQNNEFIEYANVHSHIYGTSFKSVVDVCEKGQICILDIDYQGAKQVYDHKDFTPFMLFVLPPNMKELEKRLRNRKTDSEEQIQIRLKNAREELEYYKNNKKIFDAAVVNDELKKGYKDFRKCVIDDYPLLQKIEE